MTLGYLETEPSLAEVQTWQGPAVLEFGSPWCGWCRAAEPLVAGALTGHPGVRHLKVEDGSGRALGRAFGVKLWPTLVFLRDGREVARAVRPAGLEPIRQALLQLDPPAD